jgi:hypothetical protein
MPSFSLLTQVYLTHWVQRLEKLPGVDVMITIFCDFCQISAKKLAVFSKTNVMIKILHNLGLRGVKNGNFFADFLAKIFK